MGSGSDCWTAGSGGEDERSLITGLEADEVNASALFLRRLVPEDAMELGSGGLSRVCILLQPPSLSASSLSSSLDQINLSLFTKTQALSDCRQQADLLDKRTKDLRSTFQQVKLAETKLSASLIETKAEVDGVSVEELLQTARSYEKEIDSEREVCDSLRGLIGVYGGDKLVEGMKRLKERREELWARKRKLHFAPSLPPSLSEAKAEILRRKHHLINVLNEIDQISG